MGIDKLALVKDILAESVMTYMHYLSEEFLDFTEELLDLNSVSDIISAAEKNKHRFTKQEDLNVLHKILE